MNRSSSTFPPAVATNLREPAPGRTRALLCCGVLAGPIYIVVGLVQALTREGFDLTRHDLSLLANGRLGWIQDHQPRRHGSDDDRSRGRDPPVLARRTRRHLGSPPARCVRRRTGRSWDLRRRPDPGLPTRHAQRAGAGDLARAAAFCRRRHRVPRPHRGVFRGRQPLQCRSPPGLGLAHPALPEWCSLPVSSGSLPGRATPPPCSASGLRSSPPGLGSRHSLFDLNRHVER